MRRPSRAVRQIGQEYSSSIAVGNVDSSTGDLLVRKPDSERPQSVSLPRFRGLSLPRLRGLSVRRSGGPFDLPPNGGQSPPREWLVFDAAQRGQRRVALTGSRCGACGQARPSPARLSTNPQLVRVHRRRVHSTGVEGTTHRARGARADRISRYSRAEFGAGTSRGWRFYICRAFDAESSGTVPVGASVSRLSGHAGRQARCRRGAISTVTGYGDTQLGTPLLGAPRCAARCWTHASCGPARPWIALRRSVRGDRAHGPELLRRVAR